MSFHEHEPLPQCNDPGCAASLLTAMRQRGVAFFLPPGPIFPTLDGTFLTWAFTPKAQGLARMPQVAKECGRHRERICLLLVAELAGVN